MTDAPICHIPGEEPINQPLGGRLPNVPAATDLPSALRAIRALTMIVRSLSGQLQQANQSRIPSTLTGVYPPFRGGSDGSRGGPGNDGGAGQGGGGFRTQPPPKWQEDRARRVTNTVKIPIGESDEEFVEVKRIDSYTMVEQGTKNRWEWKREG